MKFSLSTIRGEAGGEDALFQPRMFLGFGLHLLWFYAVTYLAFPAFLLPAESAQIFRDLNIVTWAVSALTMFLMAWFIDRITYVIRRHALQICIACLMTFGSACLFASQFIPHPALIVVGDVLSAAASSFFVLLWGEAFRRRETPPIVVNTMLSLILALIGFSALFFLIPADVSGVILCIIPLFELAALFFTLHGSQALFGHQQFRVNDEGLRIPVYGIREVPTFRKLKVHRGMLLLRLGVPALLFGLAFGPLCNRTLELVVAPTQSDVTINAILVSCGVVLALAIILFAMNRNESHDSFYRAIIPIIAIIIFFENFMPLTDFAAHLFAFTSFVCFSFMMWVEFSELSRRYRISPILIFGIGRSCVMTAQFLIGFLLGQMSSQPLLAVDGNAVNTFIILTMLLGYFLLPQEKSIRAMSVIEYKDASSFGDDPADKGVDESGAPKKGRFVARCEHVANTYLLTSREADVFFLLAKGRNASYIAKNLFISEGTVHTHTWRIYRKINVHTQPELMNLVDDQAVEGSNWEEDGLRESGS
jgi:DNA-binding CsgD family transcriptional regulator